MKKFEELLSVARWDAYRDGRHCHQRRRAFVCDSYRAVKRLAWFASTRNGLTVVRLESPKGVGNVYVDCFSYEDVPPVGGHLSACIERLTLEALRDVARATKNRLDSKPSRP